MGDPKAAWSWVQAKHSNTYSSEKEFLSIKSVINKLKSMSTFYEWLGWCGKVIDFGNQRYQTRPIITNVHAHLVTLSRFSDAIKGADLEMLLAS